MPSPALRDPGRLLAAPCLITGSLLLRIAGIGAPGGFADALQHSPASALLAAVLGILALVLTMLLAIAPQRRLLQLSLAFSLATAAGACVLASIGHESALLILVLAAVTAAASAACLRTS